MSEIDERDIERRFEAISTFEPDPEVTARDLQRARESLTEHISKRHTRPTRIWSIIIKNTFTRIAAAAVLVISLGMSAYLIEKATTPVWAIEQSIEAMKNYRGIYFSGIISMSWEDSFNGLAIQKLAQLPESQGQFEMWAQADEKLSRSVKVKMVLPHNVMISSSKPQTFLRLADGTTYNIRGDLMRIAPWPTSELLNILKEDADSWTELRGRDAATGKERIFIEYSSLIENMFYKFEFDADSKLLVSFKQWENSDNHNGPPIFDINKIVYYEQLPGDIFEIDLPDESKIIPVTVPLYDPGYGMSAEGLTQEQACRKILTEFWQKVSEQDFDGIRKLFPYSANLSNEVLRGNLGLDRGPVILLEIGQIYQSWIGPVTPCTIQTTDGKIIVDIIVMFREIDGKSSCVVLSNKGKPRPVE